MDDDTKENVHQDAKLKALHDELNMKIKFVFVFAALIDLLVFVQGIQIGRLTTICENFCKINDNYYAMISQLGESIKLISQALESIKMLLG